MIAYRAGYLSKDGYETRLTDLEHQFLSDVELADEALSEAKRGNLIGEAFPYITEKEFFSYLVIGTWKEN